MNERFEELVIQAKFMAEEELNRKISYNAELKAFAETFSKLIISDCVLISRTSTDGFTAGQKMKDHFGVKE